VALLGAGGGAACLLRFLLQRGSPHPIFYARTEFLPANGDSELEFDCHGIGVFGICRRHLDHVGRWKRVSIYSCDDLLGSPSLCRISLVALVSCPQHQQAGGGQSLKGVQRKEDYQKHLHGSTSSDLREHGEDGHANAWWWLISVRPYPDLPRLVGLQYLGTQTQHRGLLRESACVSSIFS
jgi:hypothetical protein